MLYLGTKNIHLDGNRLKIPSKFKGESWLVSTGSDGDCNYLELYPPGLPHEGREISRRFTLTREEMSHLEVPKNGGLLILGQRTHLEVWEESTYDKWEKKVIREYENHHV